ncbi:MAG: hypothetical protein HFF18_00840 [Oscillospiraceae bacterium]|nr:hypothetical protein [Oscillospiraceae bacterium]
MKKNQLWKRLSAGLLAGAMLLGLTACGGGANDPAPTQSGAPAPTAPASGTPAPTAPAAPEGYSTNYKGKTTYADIAEQLRADQTLDLSGLDSQMFKITGYAQGYNFDDAWFGSLAQMVNSGCQVVLASGSAQFAFNFGGLPREAGETEIRVGGVDSLTQEFADLLSGGVYNFCSGSYPSMIAPAVALTLRALEGGKLVDGDGNAAAVNMSHLVANSPEELEEIMTEDASGSYALGAGAVSAMMGADYSAFEGMVSNAGWDQIKDLKSQYASADVTPLSKSYKIGILRNDVTSDEALAYEAYLNELAQAMGFTVTFSESTDGNATNEVNQIQTWAAAGFDAVITLSSGSFYDQATTCDSNNMPLCIFAFHPEEDDLLDLNTLDSYLGAVGPAKYNEGEVGYRMAKYYIEQGSTDFSIFGGSIMFGAEQHAYRVGGMIAAMIEAETGVPCPDFS